MGCVGGIGVGVGDDVGISQVPPALAFALPREAGPPLPGEQGHAPGDTQLQDEKGNENEEGVGFGTREDDANFGREVTKQAQRVELECLHEETRLERYYSMKRIKHIE